MVVKKAQVVVVEVVVMAVAVFRWKLVVLTQSMHAHTHILLSGQKQQSYHYWCLLQLSWDLLRLHPCWGEPPPWQHHA